MPEKRETEKDDAPPHRNVRHQNDAWHDGRGRAQRDFARNIHRMAAVEQPARPSATEKTPGTRRRVRNPRDGTDALDVESARVEQIFGQPEDIKLPCSIT